MPTLQNVVTTALTELKPDPNTWMIGDTEADIITAQTHNIRVIRILSGIRDRDRLEQYQPDKIVSNLAEAVDFIFDRYRKEPILLSDYQE